MHIDSNIIEDYNQNGVVILKNIISSLWIDKLRTGIEKNFNNPSKYKCVYEQNDKKELFYDDYCNWSRIEEYKILFFNQTFQN